MPASSLRPVLSGLAGVQLLIGLSLALTPGKFYDAVAHFGARSDHLLRDNAAFYLASAVALYIAGHRPSWRVPVLAVVTLQYVFHAFNHLLDISKSEPGWIGPFDFLTLVAATAIYAIVLRTSVRDEKAAS
jgi:hypothetical protein